MSNLHSKYVLLAACPDTIGINRAINNFIYEQGASILDAAQFNDHQDQQFFVRFEFTGVKQALPPLAQLKQAFAPVAEPFAMQWDLFDAAVKPKILVAVSKFDHCLRDLLYRWERGELPAEIVGVVSNHPDFRDQVAWYNLPFYHLPISKETKPQQEQQILNIMAEQQVDLLVLARYMQILSSDMCQALAGRAINIHHSFLPSFKGAKPYHQAYDRGVKITGATAHYVTDDLDEGPIIEQDVQRVEHYHDEQELVRMGSDVETKVLTRAVTWHCEHRIILNGQKTIVFK